MKDHYDDRLSKTNNWMSMTIMLEKFN